MNRRIRMIGTALALSFCVTAAASAQDAAKQAQNKLLSKRAAEADAYRKLAETVYGLQLTSNTFVRDFVTESDTIRTEVDAFVRGVRLGEPSWDSELVCTMPAEVTVAKVIETLKTIHKHHYHGNHIHIEHFNQINRYYKKNIIKTTGMGAPRPDLPPDIPGGDIPFTGSLPAPVIPEIWKAVGPQARLMAKRAAEVDAQRKLVERIKGLRLTSNTLVRDFVAESDKITTEAKATMVGARAVGDPYYHNDELIVEVVYEVPIQSVITTIKTLHKHHYHGSHVTVEDIEKIKRTFKTKMFKATGMGVPQPRYIVAAAAKLNIPDWSGNVVTAEGTGVAPEDKTGTPQGKLMAARAAELVAKRALAERVMGFQINSSTTVRDFVTEHDEINSRLNTFIQGAYVKSTQYDDAGSATVIVEMPAMRVWEVVRVFVTS